MPIAGSSLKKPLIGKSQRTDVETAHTSSRAPAGKGAGLPNQQQAGHPVLLTAFSTALLLGSLLLHSSGLEVPDFLYEDDKCVAIFHPLISSPTCAFLADDGIGRMLLECVGYRLAPPKQQDRKARQTSVIVICQTSSVCSG